MLTMKGKGVVAALTINYPEARQEEECQLGQSCIHPRRSLQRKSGGLPGQKPGRDRVTHRCGVEPGMGQDGVNVTTR